MKTYVTARFNDPSSTAKYLGECVGTHYSVALRAAEAYGKYLAERRESLLSETFEGEGLANFWRDLLRSEEIRLASPKVLRALSRNPTHYISDFLNTAEAVFHTRYKDGPSPQLGKVQHEKCLHLLRDHHAGGIRDHFDVQNKITTWMQLLRVLGEYRS
jgi:hypothetical protein